MSARQMRTRRSFTIGFVTDEVATTPFAGNLIRGAQAEAWQHDMLLLVVNTNQDQHIEDRAINRLLERGVEGIIYATEYHQQVNLPAKIREVPVVLLDCYAKDHSLPSVVPDEVKGGYEATTALLKRGHRRIGFLHHNKPIPATLGRLEGYKEALRKFDIAFDYNLISVDEGNARGGYQAALSLLGAADRPTALFCWNDHMAMGAYDAIKKLQLRIPEDVAVVGFDNMEIIAAQLHPALTTMQLPYYQMGQWAVRQLIEELDRLESVQPVQCKMVCPLIERQSI